MPKAVDAIRIRATARDGASEKSNPREAFWAPLRNSEKFQSLEFPYQIWRLEAALCQEFGGELRSALMRQLREGLHGLDSEFLPGMRDFERFFFRYMDFPKDEAFRYQFAEVFTRYLEHRQEMWRENPALRKTQEQLAAAAGIFFSARISGYASLGFDLSVGSFSQLAKAFDGDFDSFRVFLEAFVPVAFGEVFDQKFVAGLDFTISIPSSVEQAFDAAAAAPVAAHSATAAQAPPPAIASHSSAARERAEWLWRLANGSLLIPVIITLFVMFYGAQLLLDIRNSQNVAFQPILEHQLKLLQEDRLRMGILEHQDSTPITKPAGQSANTP